MFANFWAIFWVNLEEIGPRLSHQGDWVSASGPTYFYVPPHSIIHWKIPPGTYKTKIWVSVLPPPVSLPHHPVFVSDPNKTLSPRNFTDAHSALIQSLAFQSAQKDNDRNPISRRIKAAIDENFESQLPISEIAKQLNVSPSTVSRYFQATYNLSPIKYRSLKRMYQTLVRRYFYSERVGQTLSHVGITDWGHLDSEFKKIFGMRPKDV